MHIVVAAWLFVTFTMSLTFASPWAGAAFFLFAGLGPVVLLVLVAARRHRTRARSVPEQQVHAADHRNAEADQ